jgi:hypothetical protein
MLTSLSIFLLFFGYASMYAGVKNVPVWQEILYGAGMAPDPLLTREQQLAEEAAKNQGGVLSGVGNKIKDEGKNIVKDIIDNVRDATKGDPRLPGVTQVPGFGN